jgi:hypothetical protein
MAYRNFLGEFVAPTEKDDWPKYVKWNERRPVLTRGALNPWEVERTRAIWEQEKAVWPKIEVLKKEYGEREQQMRRDIDIFNAHLAELERITKKKVGLGPIGQYGGMALAVIPGFGWFSAAFSVLNMGFEMLMGNKQKKRINQLMQIMQDAQERLQRNQQRLGAIQEELRALMSVTEQAKASGSAKQQADMEQTRMAQQRADENRMTQDFMIDQELARVRQAAPVRVRYANEF